MRPIVEAIARRNGFDSFEYGPAHSASADDGVRNTMDVQVLRWKADEKNTRKGYADFRIGPIGIIVKDCAVHKLGPDRGNKVFVAFPARQYTDSAGQTKFWNFVQFDGDNNQRFQDAALAALKVHIGSGKAAGASPAPRPKVESEAFHSDDIPF